MDGREEERRKCLRVVTKMNKNIALYNLKLLRRNHGSLSQIRRVKRLIQKIEDIEQMGW